MDEFSVLISTLKVEKAGLKTVYLQHDYFLLRCLVSSFVFAAKIFSNIVSLLVVIEILHALNQTTEQKLFAVGFDLFNNILQNVSRTLETAFKIKAVTSKQEFNIS